MRWLIALLAGLGVTGLAFAGITAWALESSGVSVLRTRSPDGSERETRVWYAEHDGALWIEAATPERELLADVRRDPNVSLARDGASASYRARIEDTPEGHAQIRKLLRDKYGARDWWVGLLQDTSRSVALELRPQ